MRDERSEVLFVGCAVRDVYALCVRAQQNAWRVTFDYATRALREEELLLIERERPYEQNITSI